MRIEKRLKIIVSSASVLIVKARLVLLTNYYSKKERTQLLSRDQYESHISLTQRRIK
jgi:hypothetical protein